MNDDTNQYTLSNYIFEHCSGNQTSAIHLMSGYITFNNCSFNNCSSDNGGSSFNIGYSYKANYEYNVNVIFNSCSFENCTNKEGGSCIKMFINDSEVDKALKIQNCSFIRCVSSNTSNIYLNNTDIEISDTIFNNCSSNNNGGAISVHTSNTCNI